MTSLQSNYKFISADDPALDWPAEDRDAAIDRARDTGSYPIREGATPVVYTLRQVKGSTYDWWLGECNREAFVIAEAFALLVRLALVEVDGLGKTSVGKPERYKGYVIAPAEIIDDLYEDARAGRDAVVEIARHVQARATTTLRPKSSKA